MGANGGTIVCPPGCRGAKRADGNRQPDGRGPTGQAGTRLREMPGVSVSLGISGVSADPAGRPVTDAEGGMVPSAFGVHVQNRMGARVVANSVRVSELVTT